MIKRWWHHLAANANSWADRLCQEIGKPRQEAMGRWGQRRSTPLLDREAGGAGPGEVSIRPGWQRLMLLGPARPRWQPLGVIGAIGTWNYPLLLNAPVIAQAVAAGKRGGLETPELALLSGQALAESLQGAGMPGDLVRTVFGGGNWPGTS